MGLFRGESLLLTGGTGSFGRAFVRHALSELDVKRIVVFSRDELKQFEMARSIADERVEFVIGDVRDGPRLRQAMQGVDWVVHAAALKQVPAAERHPAEPVKTNILGAMNVIEAAIDARVKKVIALSTDKAAHPANLYGATKLVSEKLFIAANPRRGEPGTRFSVVRYGNVVGSRGSVVPLFLEQRKWGVISITHPEMTRFWITLEQGVRFVSRCLAAMRGGEVFIPKLPSARVIDVAKAVAPECRWEIVGVRPGEKLHEVLVTPEESERTLEFEDLYVIEPGIEVGAAAAVDVGLEPRTGNGTTPGIDVQAEPGSKGGSAGGRRVAQGFTYTSDSNPWRLSVDEIRQLLEAIGYALVDPVQ